jgi:hypothetical protein
MLEQRHQAMKQAGLKSDHAMVWLRDHRLPADPRSSYQLIDIW